MGLCYDLDEQHITYHLIDHDLPFFNTLYFEIAAYYLDAMCAGYGMDNSNLFWTHCYMVT